MSPTFYVFLTALLGLLAFVAGHVVGSLSYRKALGILCRVEENGRYVAVALDGRTVMEFLPSRGPERMER